MSRLVEFAAYLIGLDLLDRLLNTRAGGAETFDKSHVFLQGVQRGWRLVEIEGGAQSPEPSGFTGFSTA